MDVNKKTAVIAVFLFLITLTCIILFDVIANTEENNVLAKGQNYTDTFLTERDPSGDGIRPHSAMLDNNGTRLLYLKGSEAGIYDLAKGFNTILETPPSGGVPAWDINQNEFVFLVDGGCMDTKNQSNIFDCDYYLNVDHLSGREPYVNKDSIYCDTHSESVGAPEYDPCSNFDTEWGLNVWPDHTLLIPSTSGNSTLGTSYITVDESWLGPDDVDMVISFIHNTDWEINHNNSTYSSGISHLESSMRLEGDVDSDLVNIKWLPKIDHVLILFEEKISIFGKNEDSGWEEKGFILLQCYDGQSGGQDNNQITWIGLELLQIENFGFIVSQNGEHVIVHDECGDLYRLNIDHDELRSGVESYGNHFDKGLILNIFLFFLSVFVGSLFLFQEKSQQQKNRGMTTFTILILVTGFFPGCISTESDSHNLVLEHPGEFEVNAQPFTDEYIATISFDEPMYMRALDYYFWDGNNHNWGSGNDVKAKSFELPGKCNGEDCVSSIKLFWKGIEI